MKRKGQATVEFSMVVGLLMMVSFSIVESAWVFHNYSFLNNAVTVAARMGAVRRPNADISQAVTAAVGGIPIDAPVITVSTPDGTAVDSNDRTAGNLLKVSAHITYPQLTPFAEVIHKATGGRLNASATVRIE